MGSPNSRRQHARIAHASPGDTTAYHESLTPQAIEKKSLAKSLALVMKEIDLEQES
jgi:hypothetical protein